MEQDANQGSFLDLDDNLRYITVRVKPSMRKTRNIARSIVQIMFATVVGSSVAQAEQAVVAISPFSGPKAAKPTSFEDAIFRAFNAKGLAIVSPNEIRKLAKKKRVKLRGDYVAELAGADYRVSGRMTGKRGRYQMRVQLIDLLAGKTIESAKWNYKLSKKSPKDAVIENADKAARAIHDKFIKKISTHFPSLVGRTPALAGELPQPNPGS